MRRFLALALFAASSTLLAQTAPYIESFDVRVNNVDVIVTDRAGNRVTGLRQEDFEVKENGVVQSVTNFSEYRAESGTDVSVPSAVTRKFVFLIDEMSMHPQKRAAVKASLRTLIATGMRQGDEAMIVRPSAVDRIPLRFTADRALLEQQLEATIDAQYFRANTPLTREQRAREDSSETFAAVTEAYTHDAALLARTTLGHIQSIVSAMAEVPGKKTMVLITEWLPASLRFDAASFNASWGSRKYDLRDVLDRIAKTASSNGIAIYTLQAEYGLNGFIPGPDASQRNATAVRHLNTLNATEETMRVFADRTGATWSREVDKLFTTLQNDLSTYYSLGYRPTSTTTGKSRQIVVAVKGRKDLRVRSRQDVVQKSLTDEMNERVVGHLVYPNDIDELGVKTTFGPLRRDSRMTTVPVTVAVPISSLTLLPDGKIYRGSFRVHYAAAGAGTFSSGVEREQIIEIAADQIAKARTKDFEYTTDVEVRNDQKTDIAVGVLDPVSRLTSFKTLTVDTRKLPSS
jgi:VWFA-related protein